jgi:glutaredoxin
MKLFSREWCSWCIEAKDYLTDRGYQFTEIDVGQDRAAYEEMKELSDQTYVPTLVAGDEVLANFDTDQLEKFLRLHGIVP